MVASLRLVVAAAVLVLLARSARVAWRNRRVAVAVWRRVRPRHVVGAAGLLAVVLGVAVALLVAVPVTRVGLGGLIGLHGNAVFAPLEEAAVRAAAPAGGAGTAPGWREAAMAAGAATFLGGLVLLFPWLAYVEERAFRVGLEDAGPREQVLAALRFGLLHLVMLIPLAAALALSVAGYAYGLVYRRAYRRAAQRLARRAPAPVGGAPPPAPPRALLQGEAALEAAVWHTTANTLVVLVVAVGLLLDLLA